MKFPIDLDLVVNELRKSAVFLFRKKGKSLLKRNDFIYESSLELGWFEPPEGRAFFHNLLALRLITTEDNRNYTLNFPSEKSVVPMDFRPDSGLILCELTEEMVSAATSSEEAEPTSTEEAKVASADETEEPATEETKANSTEKKEEPSPATEETEKPSPTTGPDPGFSPLFEKIVDDLTSATQRSRETILKEIEKIKAENPALQPEVCALVHARKHNALKRELVDEVFRELVENFGS